MNRKERRAAASQGQKQKAEGSDSRLRGMETRYGGRTFELQIILNTRRSDAEMKTLVEALKNSKEVRGPDLDQAIFALSQMSEENAKELWSKMYATVEKAVEQ